MKRAYIVLCVIVVAVSSMAAVNNPATTPPAGSATSVPSASRNSLIPSRSSAYMNTGNLVVTGNIGGGKHFRGMVPYSSGYYSGASASSVDNFLRRSADPVLSDRNPGVRPYFDPRLTAGSMSPYVQNITSSFGTGRVNPYSPSNLPQTTNTPFSLRRPISSQNDVLKNTLDQQLRRGFLDEDTSSKIDINSLAKEAAGNDLKNANDLSKTLPPLPNQQKDIPPAEELNQNEIQQNRYLKIRDQMLEDLKVKETEDASKEKESEKSDKDKDMNKEQSGSSSPDDENKRDNLLQGHKTYSSLAEAKASEYCSSAQKYLKEGKYYRAADNYALASVWQPDNAVIYAGQAWALFGAGEYMSSSFYLGRAIFIDNSLAAQKINLKALYPDRDVLDNRLVEISAWQQRSSSGELAFLLAYYYWQDGKPEPAQQNLQIAVSLMPQDPAVLVLQKIIGVPNAAGGDAPAVLPGVSEPNKP